MTKGATSTETKQTAYLAGPMRGYAEYNFPAFHAAAAKLRAHGLEVWSPAEHDVNEDGFDPAKDTAQPMKHYMRRDLPAVLNADMVCVLPGWEKSQGARLEVHVAQTCGLPVYYADTMQPIAGSEPENDAALTHRLDRELLNEAYDLFGETEECQEIGKDAWCWYERTRWHLNGLCPYPIDPSDGTQKDCIAKRQCGCVYGRTDATRGEP